MTKNLSSGSDQGRNKTLSTPMAGTMGMPSTMPKIADNTMLGRTPPGAARMQSPTQPKNPGKA